MHRYNHHGAHRTFAGHAGWAEALIAFEAPAPELFNEDDLAQSVDAHEPGLQAVQRSRQRRLDARNQTSVDASAAADKSAAVSAAVEEPRETAQAAAARRASLALFAEKQRLMRRNETIVSHNGLLARETRSQERDTQAEDLEAGSLGRAHKRRPFAPDEAAPRGNTEAAKQDPQRTSLRVLFDRTPPAAELPEAQCREGAPHAQTDPQTSALAAQPVHAQPAAASSVPALQHSRSRMTVLNAQKVNSADRSSSQCAQAMHEYLFTACATGVVHRWALDDQLQSDQFRVRTCADSYTMPPLLAGVLSTSGSSQ